ncbi:hypothetical protein TI03_03875 [Achromatium sp. WMS1]|nr:hypothetical protein TI03_03875 [Achromatium sp. WMS1]
MRITTIYSWYSNIGKLVTILGFMVITYLVFTQTKVSILGDLDKLDDKVKHILAFIFLAFGLVHYWHVKWSWTTIILLVYGIGIEVVQYFIPNRTTSLTDVLADILGILLGLFGHFVINTLSKPFKEKMRIS